MGSDVAEYLGIDLAANGSDALPAPDAAAPDRDEEHSESAGDGAGDDPGEHGDGGDGAADEDAGGEDDGTEDGREDADGEGAGDGEGDKDGGDGDDADARGKLSPGVQKRIDALTAKRREAEERAERLERENAELREKATAGDGKARRIEITDTEDPYAGFETVDEVQEALRDAKLVRRWCIEHLDGAEIVVNKETGEKRFLEPEEVRKRLAAVEEELSDHGPRRLSYLQTRGRYDEQARAAYPTMFDKTTEDAQIMEAFARQLPTIRRLPNWRLIVGDALRGMRSRLQEAAAAKKPQAGASAAKPPVRTPATPAARPSAAPRVPSRVATSDATRKRALDTGSAQDIEAHLASVL